MQHALDHKLRNLRSLLTADEDITTELDRVVCRLMKLALKTTSDRDTLPSASWLQCKLFDLLTLTERAIERRKRHFFEKNVLAIQIEDVQENQTINKCVLPSAVDRGTVRDIVEKYCDIIEPIDRESNDSKIGYLDIIDKLNDVGEDEPVNVLVEDNLSVTSNEFAMIFDCNEETSSTPKLVDKNKRLKGKTREKKSPIRKQHKSGITSTVRNSGDTDLSVKISHRRSLKGPNRRNEKSDDINRRCNKTMTPKGKRIKKRDSKTDKYGGRLDKRKHLKSVVGKKNIWCYLLRNDISANECEQFKIEIGKIMKQNRMLKSLTKPIPNNLMYFGQSEETMPNPVDVIKVVPIESNYNKFDQESIAVTEESCFIEIVTDGRSETIALRRTIATDACDITIGEMLQDTTACDRNLLIRGKTESRSIFLFDINEPSTSKGIRHCNMDVQCGSDAVLSPVLSPAMSLQRMPSMIASEKKDSFSCNLKRSVECFEYNLHVNKTTLEDNNIINCTVRPNGIQIKDSDNALQRDNYGINEICRKDSSLVVESMPKNNEPVKRSRSMYFKTEVKQLCREEFCEGPESFRFNEQNNVYTKAYAEIPKICEVLSMSVINNENILETSTATPFKEIIQKNLTCGGVLIHSYKDKTLCEDVFYQGKWQQSTFKKIKINPYNARVGTNKLVKKVETQNNEILVPALRIADNISLNSKKSRRKPETEKLKGHIFPTNNIGKPSVSSTPLKRQNNNIAKESCKICLSPVLSKIIKNNRVTSKILDKSLLHENPLKGRSSNIKNKLPKYLKRNTHLTKSKSSEKIENLVLIKEKNYILNNDHPNISTPIDLKQDLLIYVNDPSHKMTYSVFHNNIQRERDSKDESLLRAEMNNVTTENIRINVKSANSSCSSNNSFTTIRQISPIRNDSKSTGGFVTTKSSTKIKKTKKPSSIKKKCEFLKQTAEIFDDKENNPEPSNILININKKDSSEKIKNALVTRNALSENKNNITNLDANKECKENAKDCYSSASLEKIHSIANVMQTVTTDTQSLVESDPPNQVYIIQTYKAHMPIDEESRQPPQTDDGMINVKDHKTTTQERKSNENECSKDILAIIEEKLQFIEATSDIKCADKNENLAVCTRNSDQHLPDKPLDDESAPSSIYSGPKPVHVDAVSFKSFASISGYSEYFLADNEDDSTWDSLKMFAPAESSVHDLFERNDQSCFAGSGCFSGFSINERVIGDQPDYVNLINPETRSSLGHVEVRRATSEEVFTSSRSSETFVSCQVEDEAVVPPWLFRAIITEYSDEDTMPPAMSPIPLPNVPPQLDLNGNTSEAGIGVGTGAGDGRGIHSDRDSSGQDTSMSSTETSSGQQSESFFAEPAAFVDNMGIARESSSRSFLQMPSNALPITSFRAFDGVASDSYTNDASSMNAFTHEIVQSDRDADVSSLDTDIADFSDN